MGVVPRIARIKEEFSTYHVIVRGNERKNIFFDDSDKEMYLRILARMKVKYNYHIYSYCLMDNHAHLIINDNGNDISQIMKSISISYVIFFNRKYQRTGHLFQDRFKSSLIDSEEYLLEVSKYIHNNPVKAGITEKAEDYPWSSYSLIISQRGERGLVDSSRILGIISTKKGKAIEEYKRYVNHEEHDSETVIMTEEGFISPGQENRTVIKNKQQAREKMQTMADEMGISIEELIKNQENRDMAIRKIRVNSTLTLKEIGEIVGGISESRVSRILRKI